VKYGDKEVDIKKLAKELNVKETKLLNFINENKKHFDIGYKNITKNTFKIIYFQGRKVKIPTEIPVGKILCIKNIYLNIEDNPNNEEWVQKQIKENEKTIFLERVVFWITTSDWYIPIDEYDENDRYKKYLWRNTIEKINKIKSIEGVVKEKTYASLDSSKTVDTYIDDEGIKKLELNGWTVIKKNKN
jgi:hypothetical protein